MLYTLNITVLFVNYASLTRREQCSKLRTNFRLFPQKCLQHKLLPELAPLWDEETGPPFPTPAEENSPEKGAAVNVTCPHPRQLVKAHQPAHKTQVSHDQHLLPVPNISRGSCVPTWLPSLLVGVVTVEARGQVFF